MGHVHLCGSDICEWSKGLLTEELRVCSSHYVIASGRMVAGCCLDRVAVDLHVDLEIESSALSTVLTLPVCKSY